MRCRALACSSSRRALLLPLVRARGQHRGSLLRCCDVGERRVLAQRLLLLLLVGRRRMCWHRVLQQLRQRDEGGRRLRVRLHRWRPPAPSAARWCGPTAAPPPPPAGSPAAKGLGAPPTSTGGGMGRASWEGARVVAVSSASSSACTRCACCTSSAAVSSAAATMACPAWLPWGAVRDCAPPTTVAGCWCEWGGAAPCAAAAAVSDACCTPAPLPSLPELAYSSCDNESASHPGSANSSTGVGG